MAAGNDERFAVYQTVRNFRACTNALLQTALREENRAYVQIDPAEK